MPLYEFICEECGHPFEALVRLTGNLEEVICPACESGRVRKLLSKFSARISGGSLGSSLGSSSACSTGSA
jgi:putative FmdB family regulatory protein